MGCHEKASYLCDNFLTIWTPISMMASPMQADAQCTLFPPILIIYLDVKQPPRIEWGTHIWHWLQNFFFWCYDNSVIIICMMARSISFYLILCGYLWEKMHIFFFHFKLCPRIASVGMWYGPLDTFQVGCLTLEKALPFDAILPLQKNMFGPLGPWMGTWKG